MPSGRAGLEPEIPFDTKQTATSSRWVVKIQLNAREEHDNQAAEQLMIIIVNSEAFAAQ